MENSQLINNSGKFQGASHGVLGRVVPVEEDGGRGCSGGVRQRLCREGLEATGLDGSVWERFNDFISERRGVIFSVISGFTGCSLSLEGPSLGGSW